MDEEEEVPKEVGFHAYVGEGVVQVNEGGVAVCEVGEDEEVGRGLGEEGVGVVGVEGGPGAGGYDVFGVGGGFVFSGVFWEEDLPDLGGNEG